MAAMSISSFLTLLFHPVGPAALENLFRLLFVKIEIVQMNGSLSKPSPSGTPEDAMYCDKVECFSGTDAGIEYVSSGY